MQRELMKKPPNCRYCGAEMYQDDVGFNFKGNYDIYWNCPNCQTSCIEEVRFGQKFKERWHSEENNEAKDEMLKFKIDIPRK